MNLKSWTFSKPQRNKFQLLDGSIIKYSECELDGQHLDFIKKPFNVMGIDPGKNFGIALVGDGGVSVMNGVLDDSIKPLREVAMHFIFEVMHPQLIDLAVIEGASYGDRFGQVKLAEIRCGFALGCSELKIPVLITAPKTPRKAVFGSGNIGAWDVWINLNHNAADALCLAMYGLMKEDK